MAEFASQDLYLKICASEKNEKICSNDTESDLQQASAVRGFNQTEIVSMNLVCRPEHLTCGMFLTAAL